MKFELFDDMGVMATDTKKQCVDTLICWFSSNESIEFYSKSERLEYIKNTMDLSKDDFDILHVVGFTIRRKV